MRKKKFIYAALALLTLGFAACTQEEDFAPQGGDGQEISIRTRTADSGSETEPFTGNFTLELWNDGVHTTHPMTYTESTGWNAVKVDKLGTTVTALAHCGNTVNVTSLDNYTVELTENQSTETAFLAADVMTATGTFDQDGALSLNFEHYFAKVTFWVFIASEFDETGEFNLYVMTKDNSTPEVTAYRVAADSNAGYHYECSAYIPAGTYTVEEPFVKIGIGEFTGDKKLEAKMSEDNALTLTAGTHYTFDLKVGKKKVCVVNVSTDTIGNPFSGGWDNEEEVDLN